MTPLTGEAVPSKPVTVLIANPAWLAAQATAGAPLEA